MNKGSNDYVTEISWADFSALGLMDRRFVRKSAVPGGDDKLVTELIEQFVANVQEEVDTVLVVLTKDSERKGFVHVNHLVGNVYKVYSVRDNWCVPTESEGYRFGKEMNKLYLVHLEGRE